MSRAAAKVTAAATAAATHKHSVLMLCLGNICRSPTAEGLFRKVVEERKLAHDFLIDSAGVHGHDGENPDPRSIRAAAAHGLDISEQISRTLVKEDFEKFQWIVAMDHSNLRGAQRLKPAGSKTKLVTFMQYVPGTKLVDCPDPWYGDEDGFEEVYQLISKGVGPLLDAVLAAAAPTPAKVAAKTAAPAKTEAKETTTSSTAAL